MPRQIAVAVLLVLLAAPTPSTAAPPTSWSGLAAPRGETVPGEVLVKFKRGTGLARQSASLAAVGHASLGALGTTGWVHARVGPGQTVDQALAAYGRDPDVEQAQPNYVYRATAVPNDPHLSRLWGWRNLGQTVDTGATQPAGSLLDYTINNPGTPGSDMNLEKAWNLLTDCSSVVVAVVDSGVNYTHTDLAANMWDGGVADPKHGRNFVSPASDDPMDLNGHGTHVAGTIGAVGNNGAGTVGVCWKASIMAVRVLDESGSGSTASIVQGVSFAVSKGAKVINMSLGGSGPADPAYSQAISDAQAADVVVVVAAGNDGKDNETTKVYPCDFTHPNLVCVAALDQAYQLATFSNFGAVSVDVGAPGTNIVSTYPGPVEADPLNAGWFVNTPGGGWTYSSGLNIQALINPSTFTTTGSTYQNSADDRIWKSFNLTGASAAVLRAMAAMDIASGDWFRVAARNGAGDPFASPGTIHAEGSGILNGLNLVPITIDISDCAGAPCTVGFQLQSDAVSQSAQGLAVAFLTIGRIETGATAYNTENGTSMASPAVAGLATMIRAYNPGYTYADVVAAIKGGGRATPALAGKSTTGRAADAMGSLAFINAPTGLAAVVH